MAESPRARPPASGALAALLLAACQPPPKPAEPPPPGPRAPDAPVLYAGRPSSGESGASSALSERLTRERARLDALAVGIMAFWKQHGPDALHGGIHGAHDRRGAPREDADKGLIQQARHLWSFSTWYARREPTPEVKAVADDLFRFIVQHFRDEDGEFFHAVSRDGARVVEPKKQLYAESFAIFALATYAEVFGVARAGELALACFRSIDARAHDAEHLGYDQTNDPGWLTPGAQKETNTHIHLLEAFTALYRQSRDASVRERLEELVEVVVRHIVQPAGYAHEEFYRDWRIHGAPVVSYGHDLEMAWLLMDALDALGRPHDPEVGRIALALGENSARAGFDRDAGGYFEGGAPGASPTLLEKVWWVQAEALPGLLWLYRLSDDVVFLDRLERTLSWIETRQRDPEHGEWYWGVNPDGSLGPHGADKGGEWKAQYHSLRATVFTADWIGQLLAGSAPAAQRGAAAQGRDSIARR